MNEDRLDPEDLIIIEALVAGRSHREAAELVQRSAKTVQRRLEDPVFASALRERKFERLASIANGYETSAARAKEVIDECMESPKEQIRLMAARQATNGDLRYRAAVELDTRMRIMEELVAKITGTVPGH